MNHYGRFYFNDGLRPQLGVEEAFCKRFDMMTVERVDSVMISVLR